VGKFGSVYLAYNKKNPRYVIAVKKKNNHSGQGDEVGALKAIGDFMGEDPSRGLIGMSWHDGKNVKQLLKLGLSQKNKILITKLALAKLREFHEKGWVHHNLKAENIIVSNDLSKVWLVGMDLAEPLNKFSDSRQIALKKYDAAMIQNQVLGNTVHRDH